MKIMAEAPDVVNRLSTAAARGDLRETEQLLESNINVNARNKFGRTPLQVGDHHTLFTLSFKHEGLLFFLPFLFDLGCPTFSSLSCYLLVIHQSEFA